MAAAVPFSRLAGSKPEVESPRPRSANGATVHVRVNCGCGARFTSLHDAADHAAKFDHILHILGEVRPV